jgi:hypothetical protein
MNRFLLLLMIGLLVSPTLAQEAPNADDLYGSAVSAISSQDIARGMLYLRRAALVAPRDAAVQNALNVIREGANTPSTQPPSFYSVGRVTSSLFTFGELSTLTWAFWMVTSLLLLLFVSRSHRSGLLRSVLIMSLCLTASLSVLLALRQHTELTEAIVMVTDTPRTGPALDYLSLPSVNAGSEINITQERSGWVQFVAHNGTSGWLSVDAVAYVIPRG